MITIREIDASTVARGAASTSLMVPVKSGPKPPIIVGKWKRRRYQYLSHRRKVQYMRDWRSGIIQQREFVDLFGEPCIAR